MRKVALIVGGICAVLLLFVLYARIFGFDPGPYRPGLWLKGEVVTGPVTDWSFARQIRSGAVQTHQTFFPWLAHSVTVGILHDKEGDLYFTSMYPSGLKLPSGRRWNENVMADPRVRIRLAERLYDGRLVYVTDANERANVFGASPSSTSALPGIYMHLWRWEPLS
jgi:hypothetical protein